MLSFQKTEFLRQSGVSYEMSFKSKCVTEMETFKNDFQFSNGMAYRLIITEEDEKLAVKQVKLNLQTASYVSS